MTDKELELELMKNKKIRDKWIKVGWNRRKNLEDEFIKRLKEELWNLETINDHQTNFRGLLPITAFIKSIDKLAKEVIEK